MRKNFLVSAVLFLLLPFVCTMSVANAESSARTVTVEGQSSFYVTPDQASVEIGVETTGKTAKEASSQNAAIMTKIQNALYSMGFQQKNIKTSSYNFYPVYSKNDGQNIIGYKVTNNVIITTDNIDQVGNIIDAAIKNGANNINSVTFGLKDAQKYKNSAMKSAVLDAKAKAKIIAGELGKNIINVVSASESNTYIENYRASNIALKAMKTDMVNTPINSHDLQVSARINITFEIN
ncbi:SIMPL domain-containing protein [Pectinatus sottacetonis]|uniref:SIMPL domain-containing protein n=1 Tax=Pectinatus sottacetonis TaxID=1002795 RepID=UPI0018C483A2|nr:SIMPL domain-containing protein [Pectinatus sottacetonis]